MLRSSYQDSHYPHTFYYNKATFYLDKATANALLSPILWEGSRHDSQLQMFTDAKAED